MRILFLNQFFWPDAAPTALLLADVSRELAARGHTVEVVASHSTYETTTDTEPPPAVIHRAGSARFSRGLAGRVISWLSFLASAARRSLFLPRYDLVVAMTTPPGLSFIAFLLKILRRSKCWIWEMDLYPDVAIATGVLKPGSYASRFASAVMDLPRHHADGIIALGECMRQRLIHHDLPGDRIHVAENWADSRFIHPQPFPAIKPLVILYSGNLGIVHETETIVDVARTLNGNELFRFVFSGGGARRAQFEEKCSTLGLTNIEFGPYCDSEGFSTRLGAAHLGLVTLQPDCSGTVVPSKFYSLLAAGRPVLFIGPKDSTPARILYENACGWHFAPGDTEGVTNLLRYLQSHPEAIVEAGARAAAISLERYDRTKAVAHLATILEAQNPSPIRVQPGIRRWQTRPAFWGHSE